MNKIFLLLLLIGITSCIENRPNLENEPLLTLSDTMKRKNKNERLSDYFKNPHLVKLETNEESLIGGRNNKVLKHQSQYYISSLNTILKFDSEGTFLGKLNKYGQGPEEYHAIYDFDIIDSNIWIATKGGIMIYDKDSFLYKGKVKIGGFVNQFKYVNDTTIVIRCPEERIFKICDSIGKIRKKFIERDLANSAVKNHQFFNVGNKIVYHVDDTQGGIVYDAALDSMYYQDIFTFGGKDLTIELNRDYYKKFGYKKQYIKIAETYVRTSTVRNIGNNYVLTRFYPNGENEFVMINDKDCTESFIYDGEKVTIKNDLIKTTDLSFLSTIICCKSDDDTMMFLISPDILTENNINLDDNPFILEVEF